MSEDVIEFRFGLMEVFSEATDAFSEDSIDRRFEVVDVLVGYFRENRVSETRDLGDFKD